MPTVCDVISECGNPKPGGNSIDQRAELGEVVGELLGAGGRGDAADEEFAAHGGGLCEDGKPTGAWRCFVISILILWLVINVQKNIKKYGSASSEDNCPEGEMRRTGAEVCGAKTYPPPIRGTCPP